MIYKGLKTESINTNATKLIPVVAEACTKPNLPAQPV